MGGSSTVKLQDLVLSLAAHLCLWLGEGEELRLCQLVTANGEPLLQLTLTLPVQEAESDVRHVVSSSISYMGVRPYISTHSNVGGRYYPSLEKHYGNHALKVFEGTQLV